MINTIKNQCEPVLVKIVRCILAFLLLYSFRGFFVYFSFHVHVYIRVSGPLINTSVIPNKIHQSTLSPLRKQYYYPS
jgi:hypothetical protein